MLEPSEDDEEATTLKNWVEQGERHRCCHKHGCSVDFGAAANLSQAACVAQFNIGCWWHHAILVRMSHDRDGDGTT
jgi:hypothetical protein